MRKLIHLLRCGAAGLFGAACAKHAPSSGAVQSDPSACEAVRPFLDSTWRNSRAPGISLGIALPDGRSCGIAVGWADTAKKEPLRPQSLLLTGSVGKTYVAATVLQLVGQGRIRLDDSLSRYLGSEPWFDRLPNARQITVRHLLNHTSGLVRYEFDSAFVRDLKANPMRVWTPVDRLQYLFDRKAAFEAGKGWDYSDTNYIVLGMIIERVTGRPNVRMRSSAVS